MKKKLPLILGLLLSLSAFSQTTVLHSFEYQARPNFTEFTQTQVETFISKSDFEQYRLLDKRVTLSFDNGFDIVLLSANEAAAAGLISNPASYPKRPASHFGLPVFHLTANGLIGVRPPSVNTSKKYILN